MRAEAVQYSLALQSDLFAQAIVTEDLDHVCVKDRERKERPETEAFRKQASNWGTWSTHLKLVFPADILTAHSSLLSPILSSTPKLDAMPAVLVIATASAPAAGKQQTQDPGLFGRSVC